MTNEELLEDFVYWYKDNPFDNIYAILDEPKHVIKAYLDQKEKQNQPIVSSKL